MAQRALLGGNSELGIGRAIAVVSAAALDDFKEEPIAV